MYIAMYDAEGFFLEMFQVEKIVYLEELLKIPQGGINACLSGKSLSSNNLQFKRVTDTKKYLTKIGDVSKIKAGQSNKQVVKLYKGIYVTTYSNMVEASEKTGIDITYISKCCNGKQEKTGFYNFKFA